MKSLFESTQEVLLSKNIEQKTQATQKLRQDFEDGKLNHENVVQIKDVVEAGYPLFLKFVAPKDLPRRRLGSDHVVDFRKAVHERLKRSHEMERVEKTK